MRNPLLALAGGVLTVFFLAVSGPQVLAAAAGVSIFVIYAIGFVIGAGVSFLSARYREYRTVTGTAAAYLAAGYIALLAYLSGHTFSALEIILAVLLVGFLCALLTVANSYLDPDNRNRYAGIGVAFIVGLAVILL